MAPRPALTPNQQRIRVMSLSFPLVVVTSIILYKRLVLGEEQRILQPGERMLPTSFSDVKKTDDERPKREGGL